MQESSTSPSRGGESDEELSPPEAADDEQPEAAAEDADGAAELASDQPVREGVTEPGRGSADAVEADDDESPSSPEWTEPGDEGTLIADGEPSEAT